MTAAPLAFRHPAFWLSTWFGLGYLRWIGGFVAALTALPIAWALLHVGGSYGAGLVFVAATLLFWLSLWAVATYCRVTERTRPREVVVDHIVGLWLPLMFARPEMLWQFAAALVFYLIFHLTRPWPVSWADDHVPGALGLILDQFLVGAYAAACMYVTVHFAEHPHVARLVDRYL